jgi:type IV pilus assembly protein PilM
MTFSYGNSDNVADDILWEAKQKSPFDAEDITIDYKILNDDEEEQKMFILLAAAKNAGMDSFIDALYEAGVRPMAVDVNSYAFNNCYAKENEFEDNPETLALMDVGYRGSRVLFIKDGIYHSARDMNIGGEYITKALQRQLHIDFGQAYSIMLGKKVNGVSLNDIQMAFKFVFDEFLSGFDMAFSYYRKDSGDVSVGKVVLCGGGVYIPGLIACLSNHLGIEITISNPFSFLKYDEKLFDDVDPARFGALLSVATGLALRGV